MTVEELKAQISVLKAQLDFLSKQLSDLETKEKLKNFFNSLKNVVIWIFPLAAFLAFTALLYFLLHMSWEEFIELLRVLMWPVTILIVLFFFRKIFTYLFLSMEEFNFFGLKGRLKNVQDMIQERVREEFKRQEEEVKNIREKQILKDAIEKIRTDKASKEEMFNRAIELAEKISKRLDTSMKINEILRKKLKGYEETGSRAKIIEEIEEILEERRRK